MRYEFVFKEVPPNLICVTKRDTLQGFLDDYKGLSINDNGAKAESELHQGINDFLVILFLDSSRQQRTYTLRISLLENGENVSFGFMNVEHRLSGSENG